jgi:hypothetical protein
MPPVAEKRGTFAPWPGSLRRPALAVIASVPWCCLVPAALSLLSVAGSAIARVWMTWVSVPLLAVSLLLMGRACWDVYVRRRGAAWARWTTGVGLAVVVLLWAPRAWSFLSG